MESYEKYSINEKLSTFYNKLNPSEQLAFAKLIENTPENDFDILKSIEANTILNKKELQIFKIYNNKVPNLKYKISSHAVVIMKTTRLCNLRCVYCNSWRDGPNQVMPFETLVKLIRDMQLSPGLKHVTYVWHGGEPTLLSTRYYEKIIWLQEQFRQCGQKIENSMQTNATSISDEWVNFIKKYEISVGVSLDGPPEINDKSRLDKSNKPTSHLIRKGILKFQKANIKFGVLMVIDNEVIKVGARRILEYLDEIGVQALALLNAIPENTPIGENISGTYLPWENYVEFLREMFKLWWDKYKHKIDIREISSLVKSVKDDLSPALCYFAGNCMGQYLTVEPNGDVNACDKYVGDKEYLFGNIFNYNLMSELLANSTNLKKAKKELLLGNEKNKKCSWYKICRGSCPHDRRLNERIQPTAFKSCCGLAPLLEEIKLSLYKDDNYASTSG